jgi:hypothetical protein
MLQKNEKLTRSFNELTHKGGLETKRASFSSSSLKLGILPCQFFVVRMPFNSYFELTLDFCFGNDQLVGLLLPRLLRESTEISTLVPLSGPIGVYISSLRC